MGNRSRAGKSIGAEDFRLQNPAGTHMLALHCRTSPQERCQEFAGPQRALIDAGRACTCCGPPSDVSALGVAAVAASEWVRLTDAA